MLGYLHREGLVPLDLSPLVPRIRYTKRARIPSAYSREEVEQMVSAIDRGNPRGKCDLALLLLAARLGLRASDIAGLRFSNLSWEQDAIEIVQQKTGRVLALPLLNGAGEAVIDYLRKARTCRLPRESQAMDRSTMVRCVPVVVLESQIHGALTVFGLERVVFVMNELPPAG